MNTDVLKVCSDNAKLSMKEVCRIIGITADGLHKRIRRGAFPEPEARLYTMTYGRRPKVYWSAKTVKRSLGL